LRLGRAIDRYLGELARLSYSPRTRDAYFRKLAPLCDGRPDADASEVTPDDCREYLDRWENASRATIAHSVSVLNGFFGWLYENGEIERNPMERIRRPRLSRPEELDVTTVSGADVRRLFDACETWQELLCLSTLAYLGVRLTAASNLRRRDLDLARRKIRFREKGDKIIIKPIPDEFAALLVHAVGLGKIGSAPESYVIPMAREQRRKGDRDPRIIWRIIRRLGARAGVKVHAHALRGAFAVQFLETHPGEIEALQRLMGHSQIATTQIYLRRYDQERSMERVTDLSWGSPFGSLAVEARTGVEPVCEALQASA
jgi:integrase